MMNSAVKVGNAPVSYGAFERTVGIDEDVPAGADVLDSVAAAAYRGVDLGPLGYLGDRRTLPGALADRGLLLTGAYLEIDVTSDEGTRQGFAELTAMLDLFDALEQVDAPWRPRPTVAVVDGRAGTELVPRTQGRTWESAMSVLREVSTVGHRRGYEACLHNEVGTLVASSEQIETAVSDGDVAVCVDTGHLLAAGGDPLELIERIRGSVRHVHVKDVTAEGLEMMDRERAVATDVWAKRIFCPLGDGVGRIADVVALLRSMDYAGWIVVEQDVLPHGAAGYKLAAEDQVRSRDYLRTLGL